MSYLDNPRGCRLPPRKYYESSLDWLIEQVRSQYSIPEWFNDAIIYRWEDIRFDVKREFGRRQPYLRDWHTDARFWDEIFSAPFPWGPIEAMTEEEGIAEFQRYGEQYPDEDRPAQHPNLQANMGRNTARNSNRNRNRHRNRIRAMNRNQQAAPPAAPSAHGNEVSGNASPVPVQARTETVIGRVEQEQEQEQEEEEEEEEEVPDAWKEKIVYRAVECVLENIDLSEPPFPFVQRWDPQQQSAWSRKGKRKPDQREQAGASRPSKQQKGREGKHNYPQLEEQENLDASYEPSHDEPSYQEENLELQYGDTTHQIEQEQISRSAVHVLPAQAQEQKLNSTPASSDRADLSFLDHGGIENGADFKNSSLSSDKEAARIHSELVMLYGPPPPLGTPEWVNWRYYGEELMEQRRSHLGQREPHADSGSGYAHETVVESSQGAGKDEDSAADVKVQAEPL